MSIITIKEKESVMNGYNNFAYKHIINPLILHILQKEMFVYKIT